MCNTPLDICYPYPEFSPPAEGEEVIIGLKTDGSRPKLLLKMLEEENEEVLTTGPPPL